MPIDNVWVSLSYCFEVVVFDNTNPHWLLLAFAWIVNAKTLRPSVLIYLTADIL